MSLNKCGFVLLFIQFTYIHCLNEYCSKNSECSDKNSLCLNGACACGSFAYFSESKKECLTHVIEFNAYCEETEQCSFLEDNFICHNNNCTCQENFRWFQGKCRKYVNKGENCKTNIDCYDGLDPLALVCNPYGKCDCSEGFYNRGDDCRRTSSVDSECVLDVDCQNEELICFRGKCKPPQLGSLDDIYFTSSMNIHQPDELYIFAKGKDLGSCDYDEDCRNIANSKCDQNGCQCKDNHYLNNGNCWPGISGCGVDSDCTDSNAICYLNASCICKQGYFYRYGVCVPELGMQDLNITNCGPNVNGSVLTDNACYCRNYWYGDELNRECIKSAFSLNCINNEWCNAMGPYAICITNEGAPIGACACSNSSKLINSTKYCQQTRNITSGECYRNKDCPFNQQCFNGYCKCNEGFTNKTGKCLPEIDGSCEVTPCEQVVNSKCINGVCQCAFQDSIVEDDVCMKMADKLNDPCQVNAQCSRLNYTICAAEDGAVNKSCICTDDYVAVALEDKNICMAYKEYGSPCMKSTDCTLVLNRSFQCRNSICQCPVGDRLVDGYCNGAVSRYLTGPLLAAGLLFLLYMSRIV